MIESDTMTSSWSEIGDVITDFSEEGHSRVRPIAIIGMACRLPGGSTSPEKLWNLLANGQSGHCEVPHWRYNARAFYHPDVNRPGSINSTGGYFIQEDVRHFENSFFGINNLEARGMDPQQRKLLEVAFECFESAGASMDSLSGANVGSYVANFALDFPVIQLQDPETVDRYSASGATPNILANRINHVFNLRGPSMVLDTACSASLYALHSACLALEAGDCDSALVASANLIQSPQQQMLATKAGILSNSATCRTFDASADGYGRSEGVGALFLKRLDHAIRDNDPIRAVVRGTAVNSNGRTNGIMLPSAVGQEQVIRKAYERAGLPLNQTDYVEAHGTGTAVGDPIEVEAIANTFLHQSGRPTLIGSIKTNLGHSEANSGISSVIKSVLALEHGAIPPTINLMNLNPKILASNVNIVQSLRPFLETQRARISINSFGFGGANGHAILDSASSIATTYDKDAAPADEAACKGKAILPVSAQSRRSLKRRLDDISTAQILQSGGWSLGSMAYTLGDRRSHFASRGFLIVDENNGTNTLKTTQAYAPEMCSIFSKRAIAFIYTGQGSQWPQMGKELYLTYSVFRKTIHELDSILTNLKVHTLPTISQLIKGDHIALQADIDKPEISQVFCTAVQIGLTDLLSDWEIHPSAVQGHSSGELGAAYAARLISKRCAILLAFYRGYAISSHLQNQRQGAMIAANIDEAAARSYLTELNLAHRLCIACVNSPQNVTISGDEDAADSIKETFDALGIFNRKLKTGGIAYHSHQMQHEIGPRYERLILDEIKLFDSLDEDLGACIKMISTVNGSVLTRESAVQASYWRMNLENPVEFRSGLESLCKGGTSHLVELGPHPALQIPIKQTLETFEQSVPYLPSLVRGQDTVTKMLELAGHLFAHGFLPHFGRVNRIQPAEQKVVPSLPTYPWDYGDSVGGLWKEPRSNQELRNRKFPRHELLGSLNHGGSGTLFIWRNRLSVNDALWLKDHRFGSTVIFPAAAYLAMAIEAMYQIQDISMCAGLTFRHVKFLKALPVPENGDTVELFTEMRRLSISMSEDSTKWWQFKIESVSQDRNTTHVSGIISLSNDVLSRALIFPDKIMEAQAERIWFNKLRDIGLNWGPEFKVIEEVYVDTSRTRMIATTRLPLKRGWYNDRRGENEYIAHPTVIDSILQTAFLAAAAGRAANVLPRIPVSIEEFKVTPVSSIDLSATGLWDIHSEVTDIGSGQITANAEMHNSTGQVLFRMKGERAIVYQGLHDINSPMSRTPILQICWKPDIDFMERNSQLTCYLGRFARSSLVRDHPKLTSRYLAGCLDLVVHKFPRSRVLSFHGTHEAHQDLEIYRQTLRSGSCLRRFEKFHYALVNSDGERLIYDPLDDDNSQIEPRSTRPISEQLHDYDVVLANLASSDVKFSTVAEFLASFSPSTRFVLALAPPLVTQLNTIGRRCTLASFPDVGLAIVHPQIIQPELGSEVYLVVRDPDTELNRALQDSICNLLDSDSIVVRFEDITASTFHLDANVIFTAEYDSCLMSQILPDDMVRLKHMTRHSASLLWLTQGDMTRGQKPESMLPFGISRAITLEQPSLKISCFDVDQDSNEENTARNVVTAFSLLVSQDNPDKEFAQRSDTVHVSRWVPSDHLNRRFNETLRKQPSERTLEATVPHELVIKKAGQLDSISFKSIDSRPEQSLLPNEVKVEAKCYGVNAKDLYILNARFGVPGGSCSCEFSGTVTQTGPEAGLCVGDRVAVMAPGRYRTVEVVPDWACVRLLPHEHFEPTSTLPIAFATALYALKHRAQLKRGECVLIHSATGGVGIAAIQIAQLIGAKIFATAGSAEKRRHLIEVLKIPASNVYSSRDSSFLSSILLATEGQGVDVVLNSLTGDLLQDSLKACASFGRFVEIGKKDILDNGRLEMSSFSRNLSFVAFDLMDIYHSKRKQHHDLWQSLLSETFQLLRQGIISPIWPMKVFDVSEITQAFRYFSQASRLGKVVVSMQNPSSLVRILPRDYDSQFNKDKTYLLIGGFGGVGRSVSRWMFEQGARSFVYLSRSGPTQISAQQLIRHLETGGAQVKIVLGDVGVAADVDKAIRTAPTPIGGVIHASMSVRATHWESLTHEDWRYGIDAKVTGTWNVHNALHDEAALDFLLLVSSVSGSIGSATEPSYCAANAFMDNFARFRRARGLPATSLGLGVVSEVGYVHDHPEMEAVFTRRGLQGIPEDEMLRLIDLAISSSPPPDADQEPDEWDDLMSAHMLTGLEIDVAKSQILENGSSALEILFQDPRAGLLAGYLAREVNAAGGHSRLDNGASTNNISQAVDTADRRTLFPRELREALTHGTTRLEDAVCSILADKFANIVMLDVDKLNITEPLMNFGLDSMLASEFRTYIFQSTGVDLPFMRLLAGDATIRGLVGVVVDQLENGVKMPVH